MKRYIKPITFVFLIIFVAVFTSSAVFAINEGNSAVADGTNGGMGTSSIYSADTNNQANDFKGTTNDQIVNDTAGNNNGTVTDNNNITDNNIIDDIIPEAPNPSNGVVTDNTTKNNTVKDTTKTTTNANDTTNPTDTTGSTTTSGAKTTAWNWMTVIISLVVVAAVIILIIALIPKKRHDY